MKAEIGRAAWPDRASVFADVETWIGYCNEVHLHSVAGHVPPGGLRAAYQRRWGLAE